MTCVESVIRTAVTVSSFPMVAAEQSVLVLLQASWSHTGRTLYHKKRFVTSSKTNVTIFGLAAVVLIAEMDQML